MSEMTATFMCEGYEHRTTLGVPPARTQPVTGTSPIRRAQLFARLLLVATVLGQVLDSLAGPPLGVVVLHRVDQLAHEARREVHAGDDHAGDLIGLDLVVDPGEGHGELVVGVADVGEVRVYAPHDLGGEMDV